MYFYAMHVIIPRNKILKVRHQSGSLEENDRFRTAGPQGSEVDRE